MKHGTISGYKAGCRRACCKTAKSRYRKRCELLIARGHEFHVPCDRSRRKVRALMAMGWSGRHIADLMGITQQAMSRILLRESIKASTAERIDRAYSQLEMKVPPDTMWTRRTKNIATANGWLPPLAYDDIDAGILADQGVTDSLNHDWVDDFMVETALQYHDFSMRLTRAEKEEITRRWISSGRSERSLCQLTGWRPGRYSVKDTHQEAS